MDREAEFGRKDAPETGSGARTGGAERGAELEAELGRKEAPETGSGAPSATLGAEAGTSGVPCKAGDPGRTTLPEALLSGLGRPNCHKDGEVC